MHWTHFLLILFGMIFLLVGWGAWLGSKGDK